MEAHHHLQALGLTEYEARAYVALLSLGRSQPSRIARHSKIPRPKVYETLERLEARGLATRTGTAPLEYAPLSAREYVARAEREFSARLAGLERSLAKLSAEPVPEAVYPLAGHAAVMALVEDLAGNARASLHLAGEPELVERLSSAVGRGVRVVSAGLWGLPAIAAAGQEPLLVARDGQAAVVAHLVSSHGAVAPSHGAVAPPHGAVAPSHGVVAPSHGVHTHNPAIVRLVEGYVALAARQA